MGEMEERVATLEDKAAVIATINGLFIATDEKDWAKVRWWFSPEVLFDMTSMSGGDPANLTPEQIVGAWEDALTPIAAVHHQTGNFRVTVRGDEADAFCYGTAFHHVPNPSGNSTRRFVGSYEFHLVRTGAGWRIDRLKYNLKFIDGSLHQD